LGSRCLLIETWIWNWNWNSIEISVRYISKRNQQIGIEGGTKERSAPKKMVGKRNIYRPRRTSQEERKIGIVVFFRWKEKDVEREENSSLILAASSENAWQVKR
jgi:hypothetical protein